MKIESLELRLGSHNNSPAIFDIRGRVVGIFYGPHANALAAFTMTLPEYVTAFKEINDMKVSALENPTAVNSDPKGSEILPVDSTTTQVPSELELSGVETK